MNRQGPVPQTMRGVPGAFGGQQPPQQQGRAVSNRLPNGKLANNAPSSAGWAFGGGVPLSGGAGLPNPSRQLGGNLSFAQSLSGSQPATPLDLSEFPSLSGSSQLPHASQPSMWSSAGSRSVGGPTAVGPRAQGSSVSAQQAQQDDHFGGSRIPNTQPAFRFGNQGSIGQPTQSLSQSTPAEEFPPLNRNANGDIVQERGTNAVGSMSFGGQTNASQGARVANGLLNALSANNRTSDARSPIGTRPAESRAQDEKRISDSHELGGAGGSTAKDFKDDAMHRASDDPSDQSVTKENEDDEGPPVVDPLAGMSDQDRWGIKGLRTLMNNYPDYQVLTVGMDPSVLGFDLSSNEPITSQHYSLFDDAPPRPATPQFRIPDCYRVNNVGPIEAKITSFNEETLMWIFYSCTGDMKQVRAAQELHSRNWRWHKKLQIWLTKDDLMMPQPLSPQHERGYYIVWDTTRWHKERRELTLHYADLDNTVVASGS